MNLVIKWTPPTPVPACGYIAQYRRKGDPAYTLATSGSTSGITDYTVASVAAPANFEGYVQSNCCSENVSNVSPFGVNSWQPLTIGITVINSPLLYVATVNGNYNNPYGTYITGTFNATTTSGTTTVPYTVLYPANSTNAQIEIVSPVPTTIATTISAVVITSINPAFDGGGSLQQFDSSLTPPYFQFYDGSTSGVTWNGSPTSLPSFTLDSFITTATDTTGTILSGNLLVSWIQHRIYGQTSGGTVPIPYNQINFIVKDGANNIIGTYSNIPGALGVVNAVIPLTRISSNYPLIPSTQFMMITQWSNGSTIVSKQFYLP